MRIEIGKKYRVTESVWKGLPKGAVVEVETVYETDESADVRYNGTLYEVLLDRLVDCDEPKPAHYDTGIDTIDFLRANCPPEQVEGFLRGNALKYLQRYDKKNGAEDLRKAKHYVEMLIEELEGRE